MKSVLLSTAVVAFGLSMSACSSMENIGGGLGTQIASFNNSMNTSTSQESSNYDASVECFDDSSNRFDGRRKPYTTYAYADGSIRRDYAHGFSCFDYSGQSYSPGDSRNDETDFCAMSREQVIVFLKEYELYGGSLDGMTPTQGADFMHSMCY